MKDYNSFWIKWNALVNSEAPELKKLVESFNIEVTNGFSVLTKIATEEIVNQEKSLTKSKEELERAISFLVFAGYSLFLIQNPTDPVEADLVSSTKTAELGNKWMESFEKDKGASYIGRIDPIIASIMNMQKQVVIENLITKNQVLETLNLKAYHIIESYLFWSIEQGFIIGIIENELNS